MRICLFAQHKYAVDILHPLQIQADKEGGHEVLWFVDARNITTFPLKDDVNYTNSIQEIYDFSPEVIFSPGNIVPYYLSGVKIGIFHGYSDKKDQFVMRRYYDIYFTQGAYFTRRFEAMRKRYKDYEVLETGWPRQDWIFHHKNDFDAEKAEYLKKYNKSKIVLYAPTFSPSLTSLPKLKSQIRRLAEEEDVVVFCKFHPLTKQIWIDEYKQLANEVDNIIFFDDPTVTKYILMCDIIISDSSSTIYECLLMDKPAITLETIEKANYWLDIKHSEELLPAYRDEINNDHFAQLRKWVIENYDPYLDGNVGKRMLDGARDYIKRHGVPKYRKLNLWRVYTSIKTFGRIKRH